MRLTFFFCGLFLFFCFSSLLAFIPFAEELFETLWWLFVVIPFAKEKTAEAEGLTSSDFFFLSINMSHKFGELVADLLQL